MTLFFSSVLSFLTHLKWDQISKVSKALRALIFCEPNCLKKNFFFNYFGLRSFPGYSGSEKEKQEQ